MSDDELREIAQALEPYFPGWSLEWDPANRPRYAVECAAFASSTMREPGCTSN